jgi:DNA-binding GntR family transcriptional regulator
VRIDPFGKVPPYIQVADLLAARIMSGEYLPGSRMPSESELVEEFEIARSTGRRSMKVLRERGLVETVATRGSYVLERSSWKVS